MPDGRRRSDAIIVIAKEPAPGKAKTRLQERFTPEHTAELAAAAIRDTLRAVRATAVSRRFLCWQGFGSSPAVTGQGLSRDFMIIAQRPGDLGDRLAGAFSDTWDTLDDRGDGSPLLLIGMDTPQVGVSDLDVDWTDADALLGLAADGGFWAIGLRRCDASDVFAGVEMSTDRTGADQLARLRELGLRVQLLPTLTDVDTPYDAEVLATQYPELEFSRLHRRRVGSPNTPAEVFDQIHDGAVIEVVDLEGQESVGGAQWDTARWNAVADEVDAQVAARCRTPTIDLGCGPGRLVVLLREHGIAALGVDFSAAAVESAQQRGAVAIHFDLHDPLPLEGQWATVVLLDSNIGIGDDVPALLRRARELLAPGGSVICEVDVDPDADGSAEVSMVGSDGHRGTVRWSRAGAATVTRAAAEEQLVLSEQWSAGGRTFLSLTKSTDGN